LPPAANCPLKKKVRKSQIWDGPRTVFVRVEQLVRVKNPANIIGQDTALAAQIVLRRLNDGVREPLDERIQLLSRGEFSCAKRSSNRGNFFHDR
jgi:hypothetical protein